jgi:uncharacterized RDD family membrane protein YckC
MTCSYCGSRKYSGDTRCRTCGCRAGDTLTGEFSQHLTEGALAAQPRKAPRAQAAVQTIAQPAVRKRAVAVPISEPRQDALFHENSGPRVIPIVVPPPVQTRPRPKPMPVNKPRRPAQTQGKLDFVSAPPTKKMLSTTVEAAIYCEDPVATVWHRAIAASLDWSMVAIAYGLFVLIFHFMGGRFDLHNKINVTMFLGMAALIGLIYGGMWTLAGRDSAGMRWAQLQITTFDGFPPEPRQRALRFMGSCLSLCTVVGLLWSLADEESLTWQDHMSGTFPTPVPLNVGARRA